MSGASTKGARRLAMATIAMFALLGAGSVAPAGAGTDPSPFTLRSLDDVSKEDRMACPAFERHCLTASRQPGPAELLAEHTSSRKPYRAPLYWENAKAKGQGGGEVLTVTELQHCFGYFAPDVDAQRGSGDPVVKITTDRFTGPVPPASEGTVAGVVTMDYDAKGNLVYREWAPAGSDTDPQVITCGYDKSGNLISRTENLFSTIEGFTAVIGPTGLVDVEQFTYDPEQDGIVNHARTVSYVYDDKGRRLSRTAVVDRHVDGVPDDIVRETVSYDSTGLRSLVVLEEDWYADGALDRRDRQFAVRNGQGQLERFGAYFDLDGDGIDESRSETTETYNSLGLLSREVYVSDAPVGGVQEFRMVTDFAYNTKGQVIGDESVMYQRDSDYGDSDHSHVSHWHYNDRGQLIGQVFISDDYMDGVVDNTLTVDYVYDQHGNIAESLATFDWGEYGTSYRHQTTARDARGNTLQVVLIEYDEGGLATAQGTRDRFEYDLPGK